MIRYVLHYTWFGILAAVMIYAAWTMVPAATPEALKAVLGGCCAIVAARLADRIFPKSKDGLTTEVGETGMIQHPRAARIAAAIIIAISFVGLIAVNLGFLGEHAP